MGNISRYASKAVEIATPQYLNKERPDTLRAKGRKPNGCDHRHRRHNAGEDRSGDGGPMRAAEVAYAQWCRAIKCGDGVRPAHGDE